MKKFFLIIILGIVLIFSHADAALFHGGGSIITAATCNNCIELENGNGTILLESGTGSIELENGP